MTKAPPGVELAIADTDPAPATVAPAVPPLPELLPGSLLVAWVILMQRIVRVTADGIWGPMTTHAVVVWRVSRGLPKVALWDAACWAQAASEGHVVSLPSAGIVRARGIDVSENQGSGKLNRWPEWGVQFGAARASSGEYRDPSFAGNMAQMEKAALELSLSYHYFNGRSVQHQIDVFLGGLEALGEGRLGYAAAGLVGYRTVVDVEPWGNSDADAADWRRAMGDGQGLLAWFRAVKAATGIPPMTYGAVWAWFWGDLLSSEGSELWVADASRASIAADMPLHLPDGWKTWRIWQKGLTAAVGEASTGVDLDVFNGTVEDLRAWKAAA